MKVLDKVTCVRSKRNARVFWAARGTNWPGATGHMPEGWYYVVRRSYRGPYGTEDEALEGLSMYVHVERPEELKRKGKA